MKRKHVIAVVFALAAIAVLVSMTVGVRFIAVH